MVRNELKKEMNKMTNEYEELAQSITDAVNNLRSRAEEAEANAQQMQEDLDEAEDFVTLLRGIESHEEWDEVNDEAEDLNFSEYEYFAVDLTDLDDEIAIIANIGYEIEQLEPEKDETENDEEEKE